MFNKWLKQKLNKKQWSQSDLSRSAEKAGYPLSHNQISRILSGRQQAGVDACIAISHGLGVSREKVFRARGWLLQEPILTTEVMPPEVAEVFTLLKGMPKPAQVDVARPLREVVLSARRMMTGEWEVEDESPEPENMRLGELLERIKDMPEGLEGQKLEEVLGMLENQIKLVELAATAAKK